jgi:hypothetical protein
MWQFSPDADEFCNSPPTERGDTACRGAASSYQADALHP